MEKITSKITSEFATIKNAGGIVFPEPVVKGWLAEAGVNVPTGIVTQDAGEAVAFANANGWPVVIKMASDRLLHKTEAGGVKVNIQNESDLIAAFETMKAAAAAQPEIACSGILVETMAAPGVEIIAGLQDDPHFGPVLMVGLGGVMTDLLRDVSFRMLPVTAGDITEMLSELKGAALLDGFRGAKSVDKKKLTETIMAIAELGCAAASWIDSADFNPIIAGPESCVVVDAKITLAKEIKSDPFVCEEPRTHFLDRFFTPASVAVIGASAGKGKVGNVIVDSLVNYNYKGKVFPVNPAREEILGVKCYPSLDALPEAPELAIMVVDLAEGPSLLRQMAAKGIRNLLIVSGGGKELGGDREQLEKDMVAIARELDIRVIGPNCIGMFDGASRFDSFFHHQDRLFRPPFGPLSFITQSGTWGCAFLEKSATIGMNKMVSYGNRVDVDEGDLIDYLAGNDSTKVVGSYIEGLSMGRKVVTSAKNAIKKYGKPVVAFKTGRTARAAQASVSHTGAYGGSYEVYEGAFKQSGVIDVDSFHELFAACEALALQPAAGGNRVGMMSNGAGPMVNAIDHFGTKGLDLVRIERASVEKMREHFSYFYIVENPVDVTGSASAADYDFVIRTFMDDPNIDIVMPYFVFQNTTLDESITERLVAIMNEYKKPIVACAVGGPYTEKMTRELQKAGVPVMPDVAQWVAAASALVRWGRVKKEMA